MIYPGNKVLKPYIRQVELTNDTGGSFKAKVTVAIRDGEKMRNEEYRSRMRLSIIKITDPKITTFYSARHTESLVKGSKNGGSFLNYDVSDAEARVAAHMSDRSGDSCLYTEEFSVRKTGHLSFIVVVSTDFSDKLNDEAALHMEYIYSSSTTERVISDNNIIENANVFVFADSNASLGDLPDYSIDVGARKIWTGPVHKRGNEYMAGATHQPGSPWLDLASVPNTTVHDYRVFDILNQIKVDAQVETLEAEETNNFKPAIFSEGLVTRDPLGNCRLLFSIDFAELVKNNCVFPSLLTSKVNSQFFDYSDPFNTVLSLSKITSINIKRIRCDVPGSEEELIASSAQIGTGLVADNTTTIIERTVDENEKIKETGKITELSNQIYGHSENKQIRTFGAIDFLMKEVSGGVYKYNIEILFDDGSVSYLLRTLRQMEKDLFNLNEYYSDFENSYAINYNLIDYKMRPYVINSKGPWQYAVSNIIDFLKSFSLIDPTLIITQLYLLTSPKTGNPKAVRALIKLYESTIEKINSLLSKADRGTTTSAGLYLDSQKVVSGNKATRNSSLNYTLKTTFNAAANTGKIGYDYLDMIENENFSNGLNVITNNEYTSLINKETLKYFNMTAVQENELSLDGSTRELLSTTKYSYLTPVAAELPDRELFRFYTTTNKGDVALSTLSEYNNFFIDLLSYKNTGLITSETHVQDADAADSGRQTGAGEDCDENKETSVPATKRYSIAKIASSLGLHVVEDYESTTLCLDKPDVVLTSDVVSSKDKEFNLMKTSTNSLSSTNNQQSIQTNVFSNFINPSALLRRYLLNLGANIVSSYEPETYYSERGEIPNAPPQQTTINIEPGTVQKTACGPEESLNPSSPQYLYNDISKRSVLPNQYKAILSSGFRPGTKELTKHMWVDQSGKTTLQNLDLATFYFLNNKNLTSVYAFDGYRGEHISDPRWRLLNRELVETAAATNKRFLLCRLSRQSETFLGALPIYNEYFLLDISGERRPSAQPIGIGRTGLTDILEENSLLNLKSDLMQTNIRTISSRLATGVKMTKGPTTGGSY